VGLVHKGRGKASNRRIAQEIQEVVAEKAKSDFEGAIYTDRHTIFVSPKTDKLTIAEGLQGKVALQTQFGRVLETLGVRFIAARSPQAKGRIERLWRMLQSRLVIAFRLARIRAAEAANAFLGTYAEQMHSPRFAVAPAEAEKAFLPVFRRNESRPAAGTPRVAQGLWRFHRTFRRAEVPSSGQSGARKTASARQGSHRGQEAR
jgi:hypothetical protein